MYISKLYISAYFCIYIQVKIIVKKKLENEEHLFKTRFWFYRSIGDIYIYIISTRIIILSYQNFSKANEQWLMNSI